MASTSKSAPSPATEISKDVIGPNCQEVGLSKEFVGTFLTNSEEQKLIRPGQPLDSCTKGVLFELWGHVKKHSSLSLTGASKANIVGRVLWSFFGNGEGELLTDKQLHRKLEDNQKVIKGTARGREERLKQQFGFLKPAAVVEGGDLGVESGVVEKGVERELKKLQLQNEKLQGQLRVRDLKIRELEGALNSMDEERQHAMELAAGSYQSSQRKQTQLDNLTETIETLKQKVRNQQSNITHKKKAAKTRNIRLKQAHHKIQQLEEEKAQLIQQKAHLQTQKRNSTRRMLTAKQATLKAKMGTTQLQLTNMKLTDHNKQLQNQLHTQQVLLQQTHSKHEQIQRDTMAKLRGALQHTHEQLEEKKKVASATARRLRKRAANRSGIIKKQQKKMRVAKGELRALQEDYRQVHNEKAKLEEEMESEVQERVEKFMKSREVVTFHDGKYVDEVRALYQDLMGLNVAAAKCESVVRSVLGKLGGDLRVGRLPKRTFAQYMITEGRALAQRQVVDAVLGSPEVTICRDGTTKWGHKYGTVDVVLTDGTSLTLGMREMVGGGAEETLASLKEMISDVTELAQKGVSGYNQFVATIKNTMSDRHSAEKKCNKLLKEFRDAVLPEVIENWDGLSESEKVSVCRMNNFFCGLHFVVGLADQAAEVLKAFEKSEFGAQRVGSAALPNIFVRGAEAGTVKLVRLVCKSVQDKGDEKSGKPVDFRSFLSDVECEKRVGLVPFRGNRFNILFKNGGEVYYLFPQLKEFFMQVQSENQLMKVVYADLCVPQYKAGVRALGLVSKCITSPLWRVLNGERVHISAMNDKYQEFLDAMKNWSKDASPLMRGESLYEEVRDGRDKVLECLIVSDESDGACKKVLELLCSAFAVIAERMLGDHLEGGKFRGLDEGHLGEMKSVPTTNVVAERDFGMLDRLAREKPNASTLAIEGLIMWRQNATGEWRDSLSDDVREEYMRIARESRRETLRMFYERRKAIQDMRKLKWVQKRQKAVEREVRERERNEKLTEELVSVGGLWKSVREVDERLSGMSEREKINALKCQLRYRKWKKDKNTNGVLNLSSEGKAKGCDDLTKSLKEFLSEQDPLQQSEADISEQGSTVAQAKSGVQRKESMQDQPGCSSSRASAVEEVQPGCSSTRQSVTNVDDLVGRVVKHRFKVKGGLEWFMGVVTRKLRGKVYIRYDGEDDEYFFEHASIVDDCKCGDLYVVTNISDMDAVGRNVSHMWLDPETEDETWWEGRVLSVNEREVVIEYEDFYDEEDESCEDERVTFPIQELQDMFSKYEIKFI